MKWTNRAVLSLGIGMTLLGSTMAFSEGGSLITRQFLESVYASRLQEAIGISANMVADEFYADKAEQLETYRQEYTSQGMDRAEQIQSMTLQYGTEITLPQGSVLLPLSGDLTMEKLGALIDLTTGQETESLVSGHQYLVAEHSSATVRGGASGSEVAVQGLYALGAYEAAPVSSFSDVATTDWFYSAVEYVKAENLFSGTTLDLFSPDISMSRAMVMTVLYRMAGSPSSELLSATGSFTDVYAGDWFESYVYWGVSRNLAAGMGDGTFAPDDAVTRQQMIVMLYAFARDSIGLSTSHSADLSAYSDRHTVASWAEEQMSWAVGQGLLNGIPDSNTLIKGDSVATRSEVAMILMNFYKNI